MGARFAEADARSLSAVGNYGMVKLGLLGNGNQYLWYVCYFALSMAWNIRLFASPRVSVLGF